MAITIKKKIKEVQSSIDKNKSLQEQLKKLEDNISESMKPVVRLQQKIGEENRKALAPIIKEIEEAQKINLMLNPFSQFKPDGGGLLGDVKAGNKGRVKRDPRFSGLMSLLTKPNTAKNTLLSSRRNRPILASRKASVLQVGLNSYMIKHGLKNPVEFAKVYKKHEDYKIHGYENLRLICEEMNVSVKEALQYICEGVTRNDTRWSKHRFEKEFWRGSNTLVYLVNYFKEKEQENKKANKPKYTVKDLWKSKYLATVFAGYDMQVPKDYSTFARWWKKMRYHVDTLKLS